MAEGHENASNRPGKDDAPAPDVRPPAPHRGGPLGSSGAAPGLPDPEPSPTSVSPSSPGAKPRRKSASPSASKRKGPAAASSAASPPASPKVLPGATTSEEIPAAESKGGDAESPSGGDATDKDATDQKEPQEPGKKDDAGKAAGDTAEVRADKAGAVEAGADKAGADKASAVEASADKKDAGAEKDGEAGAIDLDKPAVVTTGAASGKRVTQVLRRANPIKAARSATRSTSAWAKKPSGRLLIPAVAAALLIGAAGAAGAYLVPKALEAGAAPSRSPGFPLEQGAGNANVPSDGVGLPPLDASPGGFSADPILPPVSGGRPADSLQGWAQGVGTRVGIPVVAVQAYGYAELVVAKLAPSCHLSWTTIAALAKVESSHGSANGSVLNADGTVVPPIYGLPLDGKGDRQLVADSDRGVLDGDSTFDRAIGPLQFIPSTWQQMAPRKEVDADNSGSADPNDIDDAAMAAAVYLCQSGRDLSKADAWWEAILTYNAVRPYAQKVFDAANEYGQRSRV